MEQAVSKIINELKMQYQLHTIIIYGSRARGDSTQTSDLDIACFLDNPIVKHDARELHDIYLDAWFYPTKALSENREEFLRLHDGVCVYDQNDQGEDFLK